jgi:hypothetical protein
VETGGAATGDSDASTLTGQRTGVGVPEGDGAVFGRGQPGGRQGVERTKTRGRVGVGWTGGVHGLGGRWWCDGQGVRVGGGGGGGGRWLCVGLFVKGLGWASRMSCWGARSFCAGGVGALRSQHIRMVKP